MLPDEQGLKGLSILAVDDEDSNLLLLRRVLEREGYTRVETTAEPARVPQMFFEVRPDLLLLDLHMPEMDGFELMERVAPLTENGSRVPVLILTADATEDTKRRALSMGARDFLTKPLNQVELLLRVRNLLHVQQLQDRLQAHNAKLGVEVAKRTRELEHARLELLDRLALAAEYRDDETQQHARRIGRMSARLAADVGLPDREVELIRLAAPLHDVGKIGIPDAILLKPGKLTEEEFERMKAHTTIGAGILSGSQSPVLGLAERIALTHHERWDGRGYPRGIAGQEIPLAGRIVAVADVFDALTHERPYKRAWPLEQAVDAILTQAGRQFDPAVAKAFSKLEHSSFLREWEPSPGTGIVGARAALSSPA